MKFAQSFRFKMILLIVIPLISVSILIISASVISSSILLDKNRITVAESTLETVISQMEAWRVSTLSYAQLTADNPSEDLLEAIANKDTAAIIEQAKNAFLYTECNGMTFTDMEGNALARVTNPDKFGDNIKSSLAIADALEGKSVSYAYPTTNNGFSITAGVPIRSGDTQIGVLFLSKRLDNANTLTALKTSTGCDMVLYQNDAPIASTFDDASSSLETIETLDSEVLSVLNNGNTINQLTKWNGEMATQVLSPIYGRNGMVVGAIHAIDFHKNENWVYIMWVIIFFGCLIVMYPIIHNSIKRFVKPISVLSAGALQLSTGDVSVQIDHNRTDEIGVLQQSMQTLAATMYDQAETIHQIADGDLCVQYSPRSPQDTVGNSIFQMLEKNNETFSEIRASAEQVSAESQQMAQSAQNLAARSSEQASTIESFSQLLNDVQEITNQNTDVSHNVNEEIMEASILMGKSMESMSQLIQSMQAIDESSKNITNVIKIIDDIAFQTNILALNAAVEAARAGQFGKGFAVVAEEVRNLASKSAAAAKETAGLIEGSSKKVQEGRHITQATNDNLQAVASMTQSNATKISKIFNLCQQQKTSIDEINMGIRDLTDVIQANAATAEQSAASAEEMSFQSNLLHEMVARFRLHEGNNEMLLQKNLEFLSVSRTV